MIILFTEIHASSLAADMKTVCLFIAILVCCHIVLADDFYELLGLNRQASVKEVRQAFKKLALTMHPDKNRVSEDQGMMINYI